MEPRDVHKGHRKRLRERAAREELDSFDAHQVLELLLFYAIPRQDVSEIAHTLIHKFGSVKNVLSAPMAELMEVKGVGRRVAEWLCGVGELVDSYCDLLEEKRKRIRNYRQALGLCSIFCADSPCPATYQVCMSPTGVVLLFGKVCDSLSWAEPETMRRCIADALSVHARSVILVECVSDEIPCAGDYEREYAQRYAETLGATGTELLDVILIGQADMQSMALDGEYDPHFYGEARSALSRGYLKEDPDEMLYEEEM
ncbi:MAG: hypothetical protein MR371_04480 [Clostridia bacterium]|nr:hypothetical protein [Clostridia bacterium]